MLRLLRLLLLRLTRYDEATFLGGLVIAGLCCRFAFLFLVWGFNSPIVDDGVDYHRIGVNLAHDGTFAGKTGVTARRAPLYPYFISWVYDLTGARPDAIVFVQAFMSGLLPILIYFLGKRLYDRHVGILAAMLAAFYPVFIFLPSRLMTENLFIVLLTGGLLYLVIHREGPAGHDLVAGAIFGLATLTRPTLLFSPPFLAIWYLMNSRTRLTASIRWLALIVGMGLCLVPWMIRNYLVFHHFIAVTTNSGITFMHDNNPYLKEMGWAGPQNRIFRPEHVFPQFAPTNPSWMRLNEAQQDKLLTTATVEWIRRNPGEFLRLLPRKLISFLNYRQGSNTREVSEALMDLAGFLSYGVLLPFMAIGLGWSLRFELPDQRLLHLITASFLLGVLVYAGGVRLRSPLEPVLLIFAAYALVRLSFEQPAQNPSR